MSDQVQTAYERLVQVAPIVLGMTEPEKESVVQRLVDALIDAGQVQPDLRESALVAVRAREEQGGCTALANGIAIPHCRSDLFEEMRVAIGVHSLGVDCGSLDGLPSRIFILALVPAKDPAVHIRFLAEVNRRLLKPEIREHILLGQTAEAVRELLLQS